MTKEEFTEILGAKLSEELSSAEVISQIQYYRGYIDGEMKKGKTEEEITAELGDPLLIARNIIDSPREESPFAGTYEDQQSSYYEGEYQGENQKSADDVRIQMEEAREATAEKYREAMERAAVHEAERAEGIRTDNAAGSPGGAKDAEKVQADVVKGGIFRDTNGDFNWALLALILAVILIVIAAVWFIGKVVSFFGPVILIIIAVLLIVRAVGGKHKE